ncbi:hypothetical protein ACWIGW_20530 [Nocardia brasiliensis]
MLQQIGKAAGEPAEASAVIQICTMVGNADGGFDRPRSPLSATPAGRCG